MRNSENQRINLPGWEDHDVYIKREDLLHPDISGNKYRKLFYNLKEAQRQNHDTLLTFGGAYSNHIAAVAAAGKEAQMTTIGIIRGEELADTKKNDTLRFAESQGMQLHFVSRTAYRNKTDPDFINQLQQQFGHFYLLPEGGTNDLAVKGCEEILTAQDQRFDYICVAVGTGGTLAGLANSATGGQQLIGFSALKGDFLNEEVKKYTSKTNWSVTDAYCFGGYAKVNKELIDFINDFKKQTAIALDPIYTGKMMYGISQYIKAGQFPKKSRILAIHTGGLQGLGGMNKKLSQQKLPLLE